MITTLGLGDETKKLVGELPLGWKQKLAFSVAIFHRPKIVFLDEPTGGVDPLTRRQFWDLIYEAAADGITVFVTTHYMDEAERCHRLAILDQGLLVADDTPAALTAALAGRSLLVSAAEPRRAQKVIAQMPGVLSVAQVGNLLRVLCDDGRTAADRLREALRAQGLEARIEAGTPNLEDVFVAATRRTPPAQEKPS